jgi:hypothetical protein
VFFDTRVSLWDLRSRRLEDFKLTRRGAAVLLLKVAANREVWLLCPRSADRLAAGDTIAPRLRQAGQTVWWTDSTTGDRTGLRPTCRPATSR